MQLKQKGGIIADIGWAVQQLYRGRHVLRQGWNGKKMWLRLVKGESYDLPEGFFIEKDEPELSPWIGMKTADNKFVPWLCSQTDILAQDWELAFPATQD